MALLLLLVIELEKRLHSAGGIRKIMRMGDRGREVRLKTANEYKAIQSLQSAMVTEAWKTTGMGVRRL